MLHCEQFMGIAYSKRLLFVKDKEGFPCNQLQRREEYPYNPRGM